ncbi:YdcF family protein [Corynebacterium mendelii]|uniref:YdcF family protein n=1 Tax=Corynebacterium mendelii TaxID=2765362 RepID=A0A939IVR1_9CORY|nr:YdcF family protein [Corynebacterium mendelii]MBN9644496.1 YdcF family protein [Corynebacterium mendelii]
MAGTHTVVVLGCRLTNGVPGTALSARLTAALPLIHPGVTVVVTGRNEAPAMAQWLTRHGVDPETILVENRAESTNENLEYTRELLGGCTGWTVVTSDFHKPRVAMWAWHHGYTVTVVSAPTPLARAPYLWTREIAALGHSAARVVWRRMIRRLTGR